MSRTQNGVHTNGTTSGPAITRTQSFAPVTPIVKESIGDVANKLGEVEKLIETINLQSAVSETRSPTMDDLQKEISSLSQEIAGTKVEQEKSIKELRKEVMDNVKQDIKTSMSGKFTRQIEGAVRAQIALEMREWGNREGTKTFIDNIKKMVRENDSMMIEAEVLLENSHARRGNSTLDEHVDFGSKLSKIKLKDGTTSELFPTSLRELFSYDEKQVIQLLNYYGLQPLTTDIENLNRFLAFIGLRFTVPDQPVGFLERTPPAYQPPEIPKNPSTTISNDQSQQQTTPQTPARQPVEEKSKVEEKQPEEESRGKPDVTPTPQVSVLATTHTPEERNDWSQPQEQNPRTTHDDPFRGDPRAGRTIPSVSQPAQNLPQERDSWTARGNPPHGYPQAERTTPPVIQPTQSPLQDRNPRAFHDDPLHGNPQAGRTMPPVLQPTQNQLAQPQSPANNSQYIRQQGRPTQQQQRQQEKPGVLGGWW